MDNINIKSGIILDDENWTGNILISDDIIIPKGVSVVVTPNTSIKFQKKSKNRLFNKNYKLNYLFKNFNLCAEQYINRISIIVYGSFIVIGNKNENINIGNCGWNGVIYSANKEKALSLYIQAARLGNINAIRHIVQFNKEETIFFSLNKGIRLKYLLQANNYF